MVFFFGFFFASACTLEVSPSPPDAAAGFLDCNESEMLASRDRVTSLSRAPCAVLFQIAATGRPEFLKRGTEFLDAETGG